MSDRTSTNYPHSKSDVGTYAYPTSGSTSGRPHAVTSAGALQGVYTGGGSSEAQYLTYQHNSLGNLRARDDLHQSLSETFTYDKLNRLKGSTLNGAAAKTYAYDTIGNITGRPFSRKRGGPQLH